MTIVAEGVRGAVSGIVDSIGGTLDNLFTSDEEREKLAIAKAKIEQEITLKLIELQIAEAQHPSLFVAGGRPAMTWAVVAAFVWTAIVAKLLTWISPLIEAFTGVHLPPPPVLDWEELAVVAGFGGWQYRERRIEKQAGVARVGWQPQRRP